MFGTVRVNCVHYSLCILNAAALHIVEWHVREGGPFSSFTLWKERVSDPSEHRPPANPVCL